MPAWSLKVGGASAAEWFTARFLRARALLPAADFDTIIPIELAETLSVELADVLGTADASGSDTNGGAVTVSVGDPVIAPDEARLQLTGATTHVRGLGSYWYAAALAIITQPGDATQRAHTIAPLIGLWTDNDNLVSLGLFGSGSGGSVTKWVGRSRVDAGDFTTLGGDLDPEESPVWHLAEMWLHPVSGLHFAIDGIPFDTPIDPANIPTTPATWALVINRDAIGDAALVTIEKSCVVVASPRVGSAF